MTLHPTTLAAPRELPDEDLLAAYTDHLAIARRQFAQSALSAGAQYWETLIGNGPARVAFAHLGPNNAPRSLVVISGVHGIEAVCGSATQVTLLARYLEGVPSGVSILLVHVLNPDGMDRLSRTTVGNVDLNRNLVADHSAFAADERARAVGRLFSSRALAWLPGRVWVAVLLFHILRSRGTSALRNTLAGGQFFDPNAPFYGGSSPAPEVEVLCEELAKAVGGRSVEQLAFFDLHSGIGQFGETSLIANGGDLAQCEALFGAPVSPGHDAPQAVYPVRGDLIRGVKARLGIPGATSATFECGTGPALATLLALREDNVCRLNGYATRVNGAARRMKRAFCPNEAGWRLTYVRTAHRHIDHALARLSAEALDV